MKIIFLTEGGIEFGYGHVSRCFALMQAFEAHGYKTEFIVRGDESVVGILGETNVKIIDWLTDDVCVESEDIDSYHAPKNFYDKINSIASLLVCFDDTMRINYPSGVLINGAIGAENLPYPEKEKQLNLLGVNYQVLRKPFWQKAERNQNERLDSFLITMGGNDAQNLVPRILDMLVLKFPIYKKFIIAGKAYKNISEIEKRADRRTEIFQNLNAEEVRNLMLKSDIAISAGGQTLYELAATQTPTFIIGTAENQKNNIENWHSTGAMKVAGWWNDKRLIFNLFRKIELNKDYEKRKEIGDKLQQIISGEETRRVAKKILQHNFCKSLIIRKATAEDAKVVFDLSNEPLVRANSINTEKIEWENHLKWFEKKIASDDKFYLFWANQKELAAQVRYDLDDKNAIVSISVSEKFRGKGIAQYALKESARLFLNESSCDKIIAYIRKTNSVSLYAFQKANYRLSDDKIFKGENYFSLYLNRK